MYHYMVLMMERSYIPLTSQSLSQIAAAKYSLQNIFTFENFKLNFARTLLISKPAKH